MVKNMNKEKLKMYLTILNHENPLHVKENAMTNIIILFEKQQKEIEDLKMQNHIIRDMNLTVRLSEEVFDETYIHKDKIREKIKEYEKKCDECNFQNTGICKELKAHYNCSIQSVLELLNELIGE